MKNLLLFCIGTLCWQAAEQSCSAQADFFNRLLGGKPAPGISQRFTGMATLNQAVPEAELGDIAKSLQLVKAAFKDGGIKEPLVHPDMPGMTSELLKLSRVWGENNASPKDVAEALLDVVLPLKQAGEIFPFPGQWQLSSDVMLLSRPNARLVAPASVSAELVRWTLLAKQTDALHERLTAALASPNRGWLARVVAVQLAIAEKDSSTAKQLLDVLAKETDKSNGPQGLEMMLHAVMGALRDGKTESAGLSLLAAILDRVDALPNQETGLQGNSLWLRIHAARLHVRAGRNDDARRNLKTALQKPLNADRYGGAEYKVYLHRMRSQQAAAVLLEGGLIDQALEILAPISEEPELQSFTNWSRLNVTAMLGRELQKLPPEKRFDLLNQWAIPRGQRTTLRDMSDFVPLDAPYGSTRDPLPRAGLLRDVYSTGWHLLATAKELGKLDDLLQDLAVVPQQTPQVDALRVLGAVLRDGSADNKTDSDSARRSGETGTRLQKLLETTTANLPKWEDHNKLPFPMLTFVAAVEAVRHPEWRTVAGDLVQKLIEHTQVIQSDRPRAHARMALFELSRLGGAGNSQKASPAEWAKMHPRNWVEAGVQTSEQHAGGSLPGLWYALDGMVQHVTGAFDSDLSFEVPLTGKFQVEFDCTEGGWSEGSAGYGGAQFAIHGYMNSGNLFGKGRSGYSPGPNLANVLLNQRQNHYTIQVDGDVVRYRANGQLVHEDQPGESAPWLTVCADWGRGAIFRNFKLTGVPSIPRSIPLLTNSRLRGWIASHFEESRSEAVRDLRRIRQTNVQLNGNGEPMIAESDDDGLNDAKHIAEPVTDWQFQKDELTSGRRAGFWPGASESWLYYQRPLRDGDSFHYEFFQQAGQTEAAPTIGRVAYLFGTDGVTRHWLTDGPYDVFAIPSDNGVLEKKKLALKDNDWNEVAVSLRGGQLTILLNGQAAATETLQESDRMLGFYHDAAQTSLRIRNATLTGNWPTEMTDKLRQSLEWPEPVESLPNTRFTSLSNNEERISDNAYEIYRRGLKLKEKDRYDFLHRWVMPNTSHEQLRMAGAFTPTHPAVPVADEHPIDVVTAKARQAVDQRRVQSGGNFVCPAILLVLSAVETDQLESLKQESLGHNPANSTELARSRAAMLGIIALMENQPDQAVDLIWQCHKLVTDREGAMSSRWGDVALASLAIHHPVTREAAYRLLDRIQSQQLQRGKLGSEEFSHFVRHLHGQVLYLMSGGAPDEFGTQPKTKQWRAVSHATARTRGAGWPIATFDTATAELALRGGHAVDVAFFQSPLRGNYEVSARLSQHDHRELHLEVAGIANALKATNNQVKVRNIQSALPDVSTPAPIAPGYQAWCDYKGVVQDGRYTCFVNGQKIYEAEVSEKDDPWLAVLGIAGSSSRAARNIVITGKPRIPSELDLLATPELNGWLTDYYGNGAGHSPFPWKSEDGVLMSDRTHCNCAPGRLKIESIVRYHRPMLEDGEIGYEFFYDPESKVVMQDPDQRVFVNGVARNVQRTVKTQALVHPALDRLVCLIEPDGVKIHWLTDGRFDRTGLLPDNRSTGIQPTSSDPRHGPIGNAARAVPLKAKEWNAVKFAVKGDTLTITVNGEDVFTHPIEPTNQRQFGLFHYANESNVRVRKIRYRGNWPKTLPSVKQQELAPGPEQLAEIPDSDLPASMNWDFTDSKFKTEDFAFHWDANAAMKQIRPTPKGLSFKLPAGEVKSNCAGLHPKIRLNGDFIATIEFADMKTVPTVRSWGSGLSFKVFSDKFDDAGFETRQFARSKATIAMWQCYSPLKDYVYAGEMQTDFAESGVMRLIRRGPVMYYFTAEPGSKNFHLQSQHPIGTQDNLQLNIHADASDDSSGVEFVVKNLSIRASRFTK